MGENICWGPTRIGPLLFDIFINNNFLFLRKCELVNYADDSTMYALDKRVSTIIDSLSHESTILSKCFYNNFIVLNPGKCSFMLLGVDDSLQTNLVSGDEILKNTKQEKKLGMNFFFLSVFSFTNIHESQDCRRRGRHFFNSSLPLLPA